MSAGCKVDAVIEDYDLDPAGDRYDSVDEYLLARWTGADGSAVGYRPLAQWFNQRLLKRVYDEHGRESLGARLESDYETLTGADDLQRTELVESLAADGIDAESVRADMVSWGTIATHLKDCLDGEKDPPEATTDWERRSVDIARERAAATVEEAVSSLASKDELDDPTIDVAVEVSLECPDCHVRVPFSVALRRGYVCESHGA